MKLFIDSTNNLKTIVRLDHSELICEYAKPQDQDILKAVQLLIEREKRVLTDLTSIEVNPGPGSFTGSRVGVAIANALAFALNIPVNGQQPPIEPIYDQDPHITISKKPKQ